MAEQGCHEVTGFDATCTDLTPNRVHKLRLALEHRRSHPTRQRDEPHREGDVLLVGFKPYRLGRDPYDSGLEVPPWVLGHGSLAQHAASLSTYDPPRHPIVKFDPKLITVAHARMKTEPGFWPSFYGAWGSAPDYRGMVPDLGSERVRAWIVERWLAVDRVVRTEVPAFVWVLVLKWDVFTGQRAIPSAQPDPPDGSRKAGPLWAPPAWATPEGYREAVSDLVRMAHAAGISFALNFQMPRAERNHAWDTGEWPLPDDVMRMAVGWVP